MNNLDSFKETIVATNIISKSNVDIAKLNENERASHNKTIVFSFYDEEETCYQVRLSGDQIIRALIFLSHSNAEGELYKVLKVKFGGNNVERVSLDEVEDMIQNL
jgi:hypothetical protein